MAGDLLFGLADLHSGSPVAVVPPMGWTLDDGDEHRPSRGQMWLLLHLVRLYQIVRRAAVGRRVFLFVDGDLVHGTPKNTSQVITANPATQQLIARLIIGPFFDLATHVWFYRGTEAHSGGQGASEESIAAWFAERAPRKVVRSETGTFSHYESDFACGGVVVNVAHHCNGRQDMGAAASAVALRVKHEYDDARRTPPGLVFRAHVHRFGDSGNNVKRTRCIIMPAWTLRDSYAHRIGARLADVGGVLAACSDGQVEWLSVPRWTPAIPPAWRPS